MVATSLETTRRTSVRWRIFLLILLIVAINYVDRASLSVAMPIISEEFGIDAAVQGILLSSFFWTYALMQIPGGWLADRYGPRPIIAGATILWGPSKPSLLRDRLSFAAGRAIGSGVGRGSYIPGQRQAERGLDARERARSRRGAHRWRRSLGHGVRRADHRGADWRLWVLADGLCRRRTRYGCGRLVRLLVHSRQSARAAFHQRGRGPVH